MSQRFGISTWTVIYQSEALPVVSLSLFLGQAFPLLQRASVIGRHQILSASSAAHVAGSAEAYLTVSDMNQLQFYCSSGKYDKAKEIIMTLADTLEKKAAPQQQVYSLVEQLVLNLAGLLPYVKANYEKIKASIIDTFVYASSYGDLLANVYSILFENEISLRTHKLSTKELYDYAVQYIEQNYAKPLSVQSVCDELGISPTYLSRLFRKFGDTTFNTHLMKKRMDTAIELLSEKPDMLLRDVASCVGYDDSSYFAKVFYQYTGKKPSQYVQK